MNKTTSYFVDLMDPEAMDCELCGPSYDALEVTYYHDLDTYDYSLRVGCSGGEYYDGQDFTEIHKLLYELSQEDWLTRSGVYDIGQVMHDITFLDKSK